MKIEYGFLNSKLLFVALKASDPEQKKIFEETVVLKFGENKKKSRPVISFGCMIIQTSFFNPVVPVNLWF